MRPALGRCPRGPRNHWAALSRRHFICRKLARNRPAPDAWTAWAYEVAGCWFVLACRDAAGLCYRGALASSAHARRRDSHTYLHRIAPARAGRIGGYAWQIQCRGPMPQFNTADRLPRLGRLSMTGQSHRVPAVVLLALHMCITVQDDAFSDGADRAAPTA
jgi:hypothetical protein